MSGLSGGGRDSQPSPAMKGPSVEYFTFSHYGWSVARDRFPGWVGCSALVCVESRWGSLASRTSEG